MHDTLTMESGLGKNSVLTIETIIAKGWSFFSNHIPLPCPLTKRQRAFAMMNFIVSSTLGDKKRVLSYKEDLLPMRHYLHGPQVVL